MDGNRRPGDRRSREIVGYWEVPWDFPAARIPHQRFAREFLDKMGKQGWRLERVIEMKQEPYANITEKGLMRVFTFRCILSKPLERRVIKIPDRLVPWLLAHPKLGPLVESVS